MAIIIITITVIFIIDIIIILSGNQRQTRYFKETKIPTESSSVTYFNFNHRGKVPRQRLPGSHETTTVGNLGPMLETGIHSKAKIFNVKRKKERNL